MSRRRAIVRFNRPARQEDELTLIAGTYLFDIRNTASPDWLVGVDDHGRKGLFPKNKVNLLAGRDDHNTDCGDDDDNDDKENEDDVENVYSPHDKEKKGQGKEEVRPGAWPVSGPSSSSSSKQVLTDMPGAFSSATLETQLGSFEQQSQLTTKSLSGEEDGDVSDSYNESEDILMTCQDGHHAPPTSRQVPPTFISLHQHRHDHSQHNHSYNHFHGPVDIDITANNNRTNTNTTSNVTDSSTTTTTATTAGLASRWGASSVDWVSRCLSRFRLIPVWLVRPVAYLFLVAAVSVAACLAWSWATSWVSGFFSSWLFAPPKQLEPKAAVFSVWSWSWSWLLAGRKDKSAAFSFSSFPTSPSSTPTHNFPHQSSGQKQQHTGDGEDADHIHHDDWIVHRGETHITHLSVLIQSLRHAYEFAAELEEGLDELLRLGLGEGEGGGGGGTISAGFELALSATGPAIDDHVRLLTDIEALVRTDRKPARTMREALRKRNATVEAARRQQQQQAKASTTVLPLHFPPSLAAAAAAPRRWLCHLLPDLLVCSPVTITTTPAITARSVVVSRIQQWRRTLENARERRLRLLESPGVWSHDTELAGTRLSQATCRAHSSIGKALENYDSVRAKASSTKEDGYGHDELMTLQQRESLEVLDALGQLGCSWGSELVKWRSEKRTLMLKEQNWLREAMRKLDNVWVDDEDGDEGSVDVDDVEIRRVEGLIRDQASAWLLRLKADWEWLYEIEP